jgi:pyruvate dehydrogenase E2 component (dihydrolipoamide acetyltransferase)
MATPIIMPKFGQMTEQSAIVEWRKKEGDRVAKGDILFTVETDKSVMDVESFEEGTLLKIVVPPALSVPVQSIVGFLGQPGEQIPEIPRPAAPPSEAGRAVPSAPPTAPRVGLPAASPQLSTTPLTLPPAAPAPEPFLRISPRAAALAHERVIDPTGVKGSGPGGRIIEKDVKNYLQARGYDKIRISPAAKQLAAEKRLDLFSLQGSGDLGRVGVGDVQRALAERPKPMSRMRQVIAQRLTQSVLTAPHFFVTVEVDMTDLVQFRTRLKNAGLPYTVTDFISQSVVSTLEELPDANSSTDGQSIRWHSHVHLGLAVSLEQGLVVPVIRNAEELTLGQLNAAAKELADKARSGKLAPNEMTGSTFTISNMGMLDVENFTAIINPGEAAILAVSSTRPKPVVRDDKVVVRSIMKMTLSADHRLLDGAMAARFLNAVKQKLENLELWKALIS